MVVFAPRAAGVRLHAYLQGGTSGAGVKLHCRSDWPGQTLQREAAAAGPRLDCLPGGGGCADMHSPAAAPWLECQPQQADPAVPGALLECRPCV
jgi:hypothetical protein